MDVFHIVLESLSGIQSGAVLRNKSIDNALREIHNTTTLAVLDILPKGKCRLDKTPAYIVADFPREMLDQIVERVVSASADVIIIDGVYLSQIAARLHDMDYYVIVNAHNVESNLLSQIAISKMWALTRPIKTRIRRPRFQRAVKADRNLEHIASAIWTCSERDNGDMRELLTDTIPLQVVPNPVPGWCETAETINRRVITAGQPNLIYVGHLDYMPNITAVKSLATEIMPAIQKNHPSTQLTICGRHPHQKLISYLDEFDRITLVPSPDDLLPYYKTADITLIPLTAGGGTRIKVLEAMSLGIPIIASPKAVEGLELLVGEHFLEAETPEEYARAVDLLINEKPLRDKLIENGKIHVAANHSQAAINRIVKQALEELGFAAS